MSWKRVTLMSERNEFIEKSKVAGCNISQLCRSYGISRKTGYKWIKREKEEGLPGLVDRSRRPKTSPKKTEAQLETAILEVREKHPCWGGRKIRRVLQNEGYREPPAASTISIILKKHDLVNPTEAKKHKAFQRFEHEQPNDLWQMDYKGNFGLLNGEKCHPLTVIDDHSRYLVGLKACPNETAVTVQSQLSAIFEMYGLPNRMLMDNGSPWGDDADSRFTKLTTWLMRLVIAISHGRPYHPQTQGKDERLNRTLKEELIIRNKISDLATAQSMFDEWRQMYNQQRPHEALQLDTPASHYQASPRPFPSELPPVIYQIGDFVRKTDQHGHFSFQGRQFRVGKAFPNTEIAVRPTDIDGCFEIRFCQFKVKMIDLRKKDC